MSVIYCGYTGRLPLIPVTHSTEVVALKRCITDHDYEQGLKDLWRAASDILVIEHDIQARLEQIEELFSCPYVLCSFAYLVYPVTTGLKEPRIVHAHRRNGEFEWLEEGEEWADHAGFGFTKLGKLARREVPEWADREGDCQGSWRNLDTRISAALNRAGLKYHIHWPMVEHLHQ